MITRINANTNSYQNKNLKAKPNFKANLTSRAKQIIIDNPLNVDELKLRNFLGDKSTKDLTVDFIPTSLKGVYNLAVKSDKYPLAKDSKSDIKRGFGVLKHVANRIMPRDSFEEAVSFKDINSMLDLKQIKEFEPELEKNHRAVVTESNKALSDIAELLVPNDEAKAMKVEQKIKGVDVLLVSLYKINKQADLTKSHFEDIRDVINKTDDATKIEFENSSVVNSWANNIRISSGKYPLAGEKIHARIPDNDANRLFDVLDADYINHFVENDLQASHKANLFEDLFNKQK